MISDDLTVADDIIMPMEFWFTYIYFGGMKWDATLSSIILFMHIIEVGIQRDTFRYLYDNTSSVFIYWARAVRVAY